MSKSFLANLSVIVLLNFLVKPIYVLGIEVAVQNVVGVTTYGMYFALLNSTYLLQILNDFGIQIFNNRQVALDKYQIYSTFRNLLRLKFFLAGGFLIGVALLMYFLGYSEHIALISIIAANLILTSFLLFIRSSISGLGLYKTDSALSVADKAFMIAICGALLITLGSDFSIYHFALSQTVSLVLAIAAASIVLFRKAPPAKNTEIPPVLTLLRRAAPFALAVFLMTIYTRIDAVMIEQIAEDGEYQSGLYAAGYRLLDAGNMVAYLFTVLLLPMFTKLIDNRDETLRLISQAVRVMWLLTVTVAVISFVLRQDIMDFFYIQSNAEWSENFGILIAAFVPVGLMYVFGTYLVAANRMTHLSLLYSGCVILSIALNAFLIPKYGAPGAAVATLITQVFVAIALILLTAGHLKHRPMLLPLVKLLSFALLLAALSWALYQHTELAWFLIFIISAAGAAIFGIGLGLIRRGDLDGFISG